MSLLIDPYRFGGVAESLPPVTSGLYFWFEADTITGLNDGDAVSTWEDQSANGYDLSQGTGANKPLYKTASGPNSKPYVRGDGSNDYLATGSVGGWTDQGWTIFLVAKAHAATTSKYLFNPATANKLALIAGYEANMIECYSDSPAVRANIGTFNTTDWAVYEFVDLGNNAASSATGLKNGTSTESVTGSSSRNMAAGVHYLFASGAGTDAAPFDIAAFGLYTNDLSSGDRSSVRAYLGAKYGITVS